MLFTHFFVTLTQLGRKMCTLKSYFPIFFFQRYFCGTVLHLCHRLGERGLHPLWHPVVRLCHPSFSGRLYLCGSHLFPAVRGGLPMVVAEHSQHWFHWHLHLHVLRILLLEPIIYERPCAEHRVLWLLFAYIIGLLTDAGQRIILGIFSLYTLHLLQHQDGLIVEATHVLTAHRDEAFFYIKSYTAHSFGN